MVTGSVPARAAPSRLAIRIASTTPWQYPRGVIRTTSIDSSLRGAFRGAGEPERSTPARSPSREWEPRVEEHPHQSSGRELQCVRERARRDECLEGAGDDEQAGGPEDEQHRAHRHPRQRLPSTELPGSKDRGAEHEAGATADHDHAELEPAMRDDQGPEL